MKSSILSTLIIFLSLTSFATVLTVSNHPLGGAQYSNLAAAYNAAIAGDTLILEGTDITYTPTSFPNSWDKLLTVIGAGFNPQKQNPKRTYIGSTPGWSEFRVGPNGSGSRFYGIVFSPQNLVSLLGSNNVIFEDCEFHKGIDFSNTQAMGIEYRNCVFSQDNVDNIILPNVATTTVTINNCIFDGTIYGQNGNFNTLLIDHCLFLRNNGDALTDVKNASISNSIFMNYTSIANAGTTGCTFLNNIARLSSTLPPTGNSGTGNQPSTTPVFTTYTLGDLYSTAHDYNLQAGSPGEDDATDATDIGIHGGTSKFSEQGEPLNAPVMRSMQITTTTVAPNGTLNVQIEATKPDDN